MAKHGKLHDYEKLVLLWKEYFRDPLLWFDNRSTKNNSRYPDFRQKITYEPLWIEGRRNPFWVKEELKRRAVEAPTYNANEGSTTEENLVAILKACGKNKDVQEGIRIHSYIRNMGLLGKIPYLASSLISMYVKCSMLAEAQEVFEEFPVRDVVSWNALIAGYAEQGKGDEALNCFELMQREGLCPDAVTLVCSLKACGSIGTIEKGKQIHEKILNEGLLEKDTVLGTSLVDMYVKCGFLAKARDVLEELPVRSVVSWNALIGGYVQLGKTYEVLDLFDQMQNEGLCPDAVTFICVLKACGTAGDLDKGKQIHDEILVSGLLETDIVLANVLVDMYAKCGVLSKAWQVIEDLDVRDIVSWNSLISGYVQQGQDHNALSCYEDLQRKGLFSDIVTFSSILKACCSTGALDKGKRIHEEIVFRGLMEKDIVVGNVLVDMYAKCGLLEEAQHVLEDLPIRNVISWSSLIAGYAQDGQGHQALNCLEQMLSEGIHPNLITFICVIKACGSIGALHKGEQIHKMIMDTGFLMKDIALGNAVVDMYVKCGVLEKAHKLMGELLSRDVISWNSLIAGYAQHGRDDEALNCFEEMQNEGHSPDAVTFTCILKSCGNTKAIEKGKKVHEEIQRSGLLEKDVVLGNALVYMYARCGLLPKAQQILEELPVRDEASWSALIAAYTHQDKGREALDCLGWMQNEGLSPNAITFISILKACGLTGDIDEGKRIHASITNRGLLKDDTMLGTSLVDMYGKCGMLAKAQEVLEQLPTRNLVTWSALIAGYSHWGQGNEALICFNQMQNEGLSPDWVTFICILKACSSTGAIDKGKQIHHEIMARGLHNKDIMLGTALVDMYAKFGFLEKAQKVFEALPFRNVVSWNALITGYAQQGHGHEALSCFYCMQNEGFLPNEVTFLSILSACSHSGLLDEAQILLSDMSRKYDMTPDIQHHTCMVVVFGYVGLFDKAVSVVEAMPSFNDPTVWLALLAACRKWGNVELGKLAFDQAVQLDNSCSATYVLMADIFANTGMQADAEKAEEMRLKYFANSRQDNNVWTDTNGNVQPLVTVKSTNHSCSQSKDAYVHLTAPDLNFWELLKMTSACPLNSRVP